MCRAMMYSGRSVLLDDLLFKPSHSLIQQTLNPKELDLLNLGGFGLTAWDPSSFEPEQPFEYRSMSLPLFDRNLKSIAEKVRTSCMLAHVRGVPYGVTSDLGEANLHPFRYGKFAWIMAHNGALSGFQGMRHEMIKHMSPGVVRHLSGNTDSEAIYALVMSQLSNPQTDREPAKLVDALTRALRIVRQIRKAAGEQLSSSLNLFFTNGVDCVALRFVFDFGCYPTSSPGEIRATAMRYLSLWYTTGESYREVSGDWRMSGDPGSTRSVLVASEPLSTDKTGWVEVPEYSVLVLERHNNETRAQTIAIDV